MLGMQPEVIDKSPVSTLVNRGMLASEQRENATKLDRMIARVWYDSNGPAMGALE